jgi:hypothetical protein
MPTNVTPEYEKAERRYRQASDDAERLDALREMLSTIPKHKGTEKVQADIKRRISQLRKSEGAKGGAKTVDPYHVPKSGAGQVVLVGAPNTGKSRLLAETTSAPVKVADYPFATALPVPGMWPHEDVQIELVDTPPLSADHVEGGLISLARLADVIGVVVNLAGPCLDDLETAVGALAGRGIALEPQTAGELDRRDHTVRSGLVIATHLDEVADADVQTFRELGDTPLEIVAVSPATGAGMDELRRTLWRQLAVIRVYTKQPGEDPDFEKPFVLPIGATVEDLAREIHRDLPEIMTFARIWGEGRYDGQQVQRTEPLGDRDTVEIHE